MDHIDYISFLEYLVLIRLYTVYMNVFPIAWTNKLCF